MIKIDGTINGYKFVVKPESLTALKLDKELQDDLANWHKANNKEYEKFAEKYKKQLSSGKTDDIPLDEYPDIKDWRFDVEFRAKRWKKMADACMEFDKAPPKKFWEDDDLEYGVLNMAWDYFTGKRKVPMNM